MRDRLAASQSYPANCVAEEPALYAILRTAIAQAVEDDDAARADRLERFSTSVLPDFDFLVLFEPDLALSREQARLLGAVHLWYEDWFRPFSVASPWDRTALD